MAEGRPVTLKRMNREEAENLAIRALSFLGSDPTRAERFLRLTGLSPETLRRAGDDPRFFVSVLDYLLSDERLLMEFASELALAPEVVVAARAALGDGDFVADD